MADCSKTEVFFAEWGRFCEETKCINCVFDGNCVNADFVISKAQEIVQKWSDEHPAPKPKTYADDFFEKFPKCDRDATYGCVPVVCKAKVYGGDCDYVAEYSELYTCRECWNEPYKESEE